MATSNVSDPKSLAKEKVKSEAAKAKIKALKAEAAKDEGSKMPDHNKEILTLKMKTEKINVPAGKFVVTFNVPNKTTMTKQIAVVDMVLAGIYRQKLKNGNRRIVSVEKI